MIRKNFPRFLPHDSVKFCTSRNGRFWYYGVVLRQEESGRVVIDSSWLANPVEMRPELVELIYRKESNA